VSFALKFIDNNKKQLTKHFEYVIYYLRGNMKILKIISIIITAITPLLILNNIYTTLLCFLYDTNIRTIIGFLITTFLIIINIILILSKNKILFKNNNDGYIY
jgi:predicted permease